MIPVSLTIKGIYSYQQKQHIDFSHLIEAGIFGIFGKVGSGKSSILEAVMLTLYGEIERLNKRDNRAYNLLNLKSNDFLIDFVFKNNQDNEYRFIVKGKRNSKKFDEVSFKRFAYKKEKNDWQPIPVDSAAEIIGLNYDNFRRTIIIPQGKFQDFLQLTDGERTKMMKELFRLHRFDFSAKVSKLEKENENNLSGVQGQLMQLKDVSEEKIKELKIEIKQISNELTVAKQEQETLQKQNEKWNKIKEVFEQIEKLKVEFETLEKEKIKYEHLENELKEYNYCVHYFKSPVENKKRLEKQQKLLQNNLEQYQMQLSALNKAVFENESKFTKLKPVYDKRDELKKQADELQKIQKIKNLEIQINRFSERIENGDKTIIQNKEKIDFLNKEKSGLQQKIVSIKENLPDLNLLSKIKDWFTVKSILEKQISDQKTELEHVLQKLKSTENELFSLVGNKLEQKVQDKIVTEKYFTEKIAGQEQEIRKIEEYLQQLNVKQALIDHARNLQEGEACPVCGSTHHPEKIKEDDLQKEIKKQKADLNRAKENLKTLNNNLQLLRQIYIKIDADKEQKIKIETKITALKQEFDLHQKKYPAKEKITREELDKLFDKAADQQQELKTFEQNLQNTEKQIEKEQKNRENYLKAINELNNKLIQNQSEKSTLQEQIKNLRIADYESLTEDEINDEIAALLNRYKKITEDFEQLNKELNIQHKEVATLNGKIQSMEKEFEIINSDLQKTDAELKKLIKNSDYDNLNRVVELLNKSLDVNGLSAEIETYKQKYFNTETQLKNLQKQAGNTVYEKEKHNELIARLEKIKHRMEQLGKKAGALENDQKQLVNKLKEKEKLQKDLEKLQLRAENIRTLKSLFAGNGFVNYVSSVYLQNLVIAANSRFFKLTGQKLKLELNENNNFEVRDFLNGGKLRSVKTLSGGQTFQASLSLALALADNVHELSGAKHNFFFLDEGFGSLDKDALNVVFDTLKTLRKENRIVGIISHVEELQQEIETYLKIENNVQKGSLVYKSWEN